MFLDTVLDALVRTYVLLLLVVVVVVVVVVVEEKVHTTST